MTPKGIIRTPPTRYETVAILRQNAARRPRGFGDGEPRAARTRGDDRSARVRAVYDAPARPAGPAEGGINHPGGDGFDRCARGPDAGAPAGRDLAAVRARRRLRRGAFP